jgi:hypothetical protein
MPHVNSYQPWWVRCWIMGIVLALMLPVSPAGAGPDYTLRVFVEGSYPDLTVTAESGAVHPVRLYTGNWSTPVRVQGELPWVLAGFGGKGKVDWGTLEELPSDGKSYLLIIVPERAGYARLALFPVSETIQPGLMLINLSGFELTGEYDENAFSLGKGGFHQWSGLNRRASIVARTEDGRTVLPETWIDTREEPITLLLLPPFMRNSAMAQSRILRFNEVSAEETDENAPP